MAGMKVDYYGWTGTGFGCGLAGMETMFVSYTIVLSGFLYICIIMMTEISSSM